MSKLLLALVIVSGCSRTVFVTLDFSDGNSCEITNTQTVGSASIALLDEGLTQIQHKGLSVAAGDLIHEFTPELRVQYTSSDKKLDTWFISPEGAIKQTHDNIYLCWQGKFNNVVGRLRHLKNQ